MAEWLTRWTVVAVVLGSLLGPLNLRLGHKSDIVLVTKGIMTQCSKNYS